LYLDNAALDATVGLTDASNPRADHELFLGIVGAERARPSEVAEEWDEVVSHLPREVHPAVLDLVAVHIGIDAEPKAVLVRE
jgi:hypothetical protein